MENSIDKVLNNTKDIEKKYQDIVKWDRMYILYSFIGIYQIGLHIYYPEEYIRTGYTIKHKCSTTKSVFFGKDHLNEIINKEKRYKSFKELNSIIINSDYLKVYDSIGNVIPIWPGGNVDKGKYSYCFDIPDIYFSKYPKWVNALKMIYNDVYVDDIVNNNKFYVNTIKFLEMMNRTNYKEFLNHVVSVIMNREKILKRKYRV